MNIVNLLNFTNLLHFTYVYLSHINITIITNAIIEKKYATLSTNVKFSEKCGRERGKGKEGRERVVDR